MDERVELDFYECAGEIVRRLHECGVLCVVADGAGRQNVLTVGWGQVGPFYHGNPVFAVAVTPLRHSWRFLEETLEFVIAVPDDERRAAAALCGSTSGRDLDKFDAAGLTRVPSVHVAPPSVRECPINVECRVYARVPPPHMLLTPEHRQRPVQDQHSIYFAEVLGTYGWRPVAPL